MRFTWFLLMWLLPASTAHSADWFLGASAGATYFWEDGGESSTLSLGIPVTGPSLEFSPGVRLGAASDTGFEAALELAPSYRTSSEVFTSFSVLAVLNLQKTLWGDATWNPSVGLGLGAGYFSFEDLSPAGRGALSGTTMVGHISVGMVYWLEHRKGRLRSELRYMRSGSVTDSGTRLVPQGNNAQLLLGFDLFVR